MFHSSQPSWLLRTVFLSLIVICFWQANRSADGTASPRDATLSEVDTHPVSMDGVSSERNLVTVPIRDLRPGMRVLADNPELPGPIQSDSEVDQQTWRLIRLEMVKPNGGLLNIELLRPVEWVFAQAFALADRNNDPTIFLPRPLTVGVSEAPLADLLLGRTIELDLAELGAQGPALVTAITPCPEIETDSSSDRRLITGTFHHSAGNVVDLETSSQSESIGVTDNHPFWSVDRQSFVPAGELQVGENLQNADGTLTQVTRITPRRGPPVDVFNLEVDVDHVYYVGVDGVLVHNSYNELHHYWPVWLGNRVPRGNTDILTPLDYNVHTELHDALRVYLRNDHPELMYGPSRAGINIVRETRLRDRLSALDEFYRTFENGSHYDAWSDEVFDTIFSGRYR